MVDRSNPLRELNAAGQSVWYDNIHRSMLTFGELARLIVADDLRGVTSNPTIFDKAITGTHEYDAFLRRELRLHPDQSSRELFFTLAIEDIRDAADVLRPVYEATAGVDGRVSLEVSPDLANATEATIHEGKTLHERVHRPNVMIKVPATRKGLPAIEALTAKGISVNVTLLFSVERYLEVAEAYMKGLERRVEEKLPVDQIASVASFFVSRVDSALDPVLAEKRPELQGKIAIANAKVAYQHFKELFGGERFAALKRAGARPQRLLWASTGIKNPNYSDVLYVESLIGPQTVNTLPPATYTAFRDHGTVRPTLEQDVAGARAQIAALADLGIDLTEVTGRLEKEGVDGFAKSFENLLAHLDAKAESLAA